MYVRMLAEQEHHLHVHRRNKVGTKNINSINNDYTMAHDDASNKSQK